MITKLQLTRAKTNVREKNQKVYTQKKPSNTMKKQPMCICVSDKMLINKNIKEFQ